MVEFDAEFDAEFDVKFEVLEKAGYHYFRLFQI